MNITEFLARLTGVKKCGDGWQARCPAHDDRKASLSITDGNKQPIVVKCHAGCSTESIVAALGLKVGELSTPQPKVNSHMKPRIIAAYPYQDETGKVLFETVRYEPKDFKQRRPDPAKPGKWIWNLKGVRRVLYRLPELKAAIVTGQTIYIVAGEKDVGAMAQHGFAATCNPLGEKKDGSSWLPEYTETLRDAASVIVIADKDETGRAHAPIVATALRAAVKGVKMIELPDVNGKPVKDSFDFFAAGGTADELRAIGEAAPEFVPTSEPRSAGQDGRASVTPAQWFAEKFPALADEYGDAILEETDEAGIVSARDIGEDFLAGTLGDKGSPNAPTVFLPTEEKFYTYLPAEGIFVQQRDAVLLARLSRLLLDCARQCREGCQTKTLEFRFRDSASLSGVLRKARGLLETPHDFFSTDLTEYIPCANGMLRLRDKTLLPFNPLYRRRNKLAVPFDPAAECPLFLDTLMRQALDESELDLLQRWCGLALIGENLAQRILILTGTAGGGKGTFIRVLNGIIGQTNLASLRPQLLGERFEVGRFLGKTLLYGADVPENFLNQRGASVLKSLTGYDPVTLEFKNSNESPAIICRFNVVVTCNARLTVHLEGDTDAWRRRLAMIPYHKPKPERVIADLDQQILQKESSGVLNWMLAGLDKICADDWQLRLTANQQAAVDNLLLESDGHAVFARECLRRDASQSLTVPDCFAAYVEFCNQRGWTALAKNRFGALIGDVVVRQFGVTQCHNIPDAGGKPQRGWRGITLGEKTAQPTDKTASHSSQTQFRDEWDTSSPVQLGKT